MKIIDLFNKIANNEIENDFWFKIEGYKEKFLIVFVIENGYTIYKMTDTGIGNLEKFHIDRLILNRYIKIIKEK